MEDWWNSLSMQEVAKLISDGVNNGITSLDEIKNTAYNIFQEGGLRRYSGKNLTEAEFLEEKRKAAINTAINTALAKTEGVAPILEYDDLGQPVYGESCIYTATDSFGRQYRIAGNKTFNSTLGKNGFVVAGPLDENPQNNIGRLYQFFDSRNEDGSDLYPSHMGILTGIKDGNNLITYSRGNAGNIDNTYYGTEGDEGPDYRINSSLWESPAYETYKFVGTPEDNKKWLHEFQELPEVPEDLPKVTAFPQQYAVSLAKSPKYKSGGKIHIKPENRGKFTALKKRTGHSATWFKQHGTPAQKKMATFELNSRHWNHKHADGGYLLGQVYDLSEEQVQELIRQGYEVERV